MLFIIFFNLGFPFWGEFLSNDSNVSNYGDSPTPRLRDKNGTFSDVCMCVWCKQSCDEENW